MLSNKERLTIAEKKIEELLAAKKKNDDRIAMENAINDFIKKQEKGFFKYALDAFKLLVILAAIYTGGQKALDAPWVSNAIKTMGSK